MTFVLLATSGAIGTQEYTNSLAEGFIVTGVQSVHSCPKFRTDELFYKDVVHSGMCG